MSRRALHLCLLVVTLASLDATLAASSTRAQAMLPGSPREANPRYQAYLLTRRAPGKAAGYELLFPGAGNLYTRIYVNAVISAVVSLTGAALWIHGGVKDNDVTYWTGASLFAGGRIHGLISAPVGAAMYNAVLRQHLRLSMSPTAVSLRF